MAYDATKPTDDEYLSAFPAEMREQLRAIIQDAIVNALTVNGYSPGNLNGNIPVSNGNLNANLNADKLDGHDATYFSADGHVHTTATQSTNGFMANTDKAKLDSIATGAEVNQNAFSNVAVGSTTIQADSKADTLTLAAGANIAITPDATNDNVTIAVTGTVPAATVADGINIVSGNEIKLRGSSSYGGGILFGYDAPAKVNEYKFCDGTRTGVLADITAHSFNGNLHGTADNANKLGGYSINTENGGTWGSIPFMTTAGVMEVGKYIDWHATNGGDADYTTRFTAEDNGTVTVGAINGTLNGTADNANSINIVSGNEIKLSGSSNYDGSIWFGYDAPAKINEYKFGDGTRTTALASITAASFNGALHGTADNASTLNGYTAAQLLAASSRVVAVQQVITWRGTLNDSGVVVGTWNPPAGYTREQCVAIASPASAVTQLGAVCASAETDGRVILRCGNATTVTYEVRVLVVAIK